jgi:hypothetical protein
MSWVPSSIIAKGANKIEFGFPHFVWYQSIFLWIKVQLVSQTQPNIPVPQYAKL